MLSKTDALNALSLIWQVDRPITGGDCLKILRTAAGMDMGDLADKVGIHRVTLGKYEAGISEPTVEIAKKIGDVLNVEWTIFFCD